MSRRFIINAAALALGIALGVYFSLNRVPSEANTPPAPIALGQLPAFTLPDLTGAAQSSSQWAGKILVLNFWATWCPPCLREIPDFIKLQAELGGQGLQFVGIAVDSSEAVRQFAAQQGFNYPILIGGQDAVQLSEQLGNRYQGLPFSVIFDRQGKPVHIQVGELKPATVRETLSSLL